MYASCAQVVVASDGINPKCIPNRKTPTLSVHGKGSFVTVRLKKTQPNDYGVEQLWLLTNYGWTPDRIVGSKEKKTLTMLIYNEQPLSIGVIGYELISSIDNHDAGHAGDGYMNEVEVDSKVKQRRSSIRNETNKDARFCIEMEIPIRNMDPFKDNIKIGVNKKQRQILGEKYDDMSIVRIYRTFGQLLSLDRELDIHESYLGVRFPESLHDVDVASSLIDLWLKAIVRTQQIVDTPSLSSFLEPNDEDVQLIEAELEKEGGIDSSWKDVIDALDVDRQHFAGVG